jgi:hypothetical protein
MTLLRSGTRETPHTARVDLSATPGLPSAALVFLGGFLLHNADHLRRGLDILTPEVLWAGSSSGLITLAAIGLAVAGHRLARQVAVVVGFGMAIGVSSVHLLPRWSSFSDSLSAANADPLTWLAVLCEVGGALVFGWAGIRALASTMSPKTRPTRSTA